jgi:hypothetical protein
MQSLRILSPTRPQHIAGAVPSKLDFETPHFFFQIDEKTGAIRRLNHKATNQEWAAQDHPLALFTYQTLSQKDYDAFFKNYVISTEDWAFKDFGKPNIERYGAVSKIWMPSLAQCEITETAEIHRVRTRLEFRANQLPKSDSLVPPATAWPKQVFVEYFARKSAPTIEINVSWFDKLPTRMPEALWFSFNPQVADLKTWSMQKSGQQVSPFDVVEGGNRHMHAIDGRISCRNGAHELALTTQDAPLLALGVQSPLYFTREQPQLEQGIHFNLFNNAWGTNYIMWYMEDMRFRFRIEAK